jgi:hypothetical protein
MVPAQIDGVALVPAAREKSLVSLPIPRAAEHAVYQQDRRFAARRRRTLDRDGQVADARGLWRRGQEAFG